MTKVVMRFLGRPHIHICGECLVRWHSRDDQTILEVTLRRCPTCSKRTMFDQRVDREHPRDLPADRRLTPSPLSRIFKYLASSPKPIA
jgi:hypothetical protein